MNYLAPVLLNFFIFWFFFFKFNGKFSKEALIFDKKINKQTLIEKKPIFFLFFNFYLFITFFFLFFYFFEAYDKTYWWGHFYITEINLNIFIFSLICSVFFFKILYFYFLQFNYYSYEYVFCIKNIFIFSPFFFL